MFVGTLEFRRSLQTDGYSCGAHCCYMIARHFGLGLSYREVKRLVETDETGTRVAAMAAFFRRRGLKVARWTTMKMRDLEGVLDRGAVALVHVDGDHFAVAHALSRKSVWVADPSLFRQLGRRTSRARFKRRWQRWALVVRE